MTYEEERQKRREQEAEWRKRREDRWARDALIRRLKQVGLECFGALVIACMFYSYIKDTTP
jgi:hypothetical protein